MKKLLILLGCILLLCGCMKKEERVVLDYQNDFITYKADMSGYEGLTSSNHRFLGITVSELKKAIDAYNKRDRRFGGLKETNDTEDK